MKMLAQSVYPTRPPGGRMDVDFVVQGFDQTVGLSRYTASLLPRLDEECDVTVRRPRLPEAVSRPLGALGDAETFFSAFPLDYERSTGDVLHLSTQTMGIPLLYRDLPPTVVTVHDVLPYVFECDTQFAPIEPWYERGFYRLAVRGIRAADHVVAISEATKRTLQEYLDIPASRITRVYYGVDHDAFRPRGVTDRTYERYGLDPDDRHVLYVGSERPRKAVPELVEAFADVLDEVPDATLVKVGGPERPAFRERTAAAVRREGIEDSVVFTGHVEEGLDRLYNLADVYASATYYEGFGLPFVEAMATGTPVVGRNRGAMKEVIGSGGLLFDSRSELTEALVGVLTGEAGSSLAAAASERAASFSWEKNAAKTREVYRAVSS